jgi:hypothetical protein
MEKDDNSRDRNERGRYENIEPESAKNNEFAVERTARSGPEVPLISAKSIGDKAHTAVKETAEDYLNIAGLKVDLNRVEERIRNRPFYYLGLASGAGFIVGGGLATNIGRAVLALFGRKAASQAAANFGRRVFQPDLSGIRIPSHAVR